MLILITILQIILFTSYVVYIRTRFGKLTSISASTYSFTKNDKYIFFGWLVLLGVLNLAQGMEVWGFFTTAALVFTGITVDHDGSFKAENRLHSIAAVSAIVLGALGLFFMHGMIFPAVVIIIGIITLYENRYFIWDIEVIAMYTIMLGYLMR